MSAALAAGILHGRSWERAHGRDCRLLMHDGTPLVVVGRVQSRSASGLRIMLAVQEGLGPECGGVVRVVLPRRGSAGPGPGVADPPVATGTRLEVTGRWRRLGGTALYPEYAGELIAGDVREAPGPERGGFLLGRRARVEASLVRLYPERHGVVAALILARNEGIGPELREAFARSGTAHLLAISGFHVCVMGGLLVLAARALGASTRGAGVLAALVVWAYVVFIGAPDAAARAAVMLSLFAAGALRGRPLSRAGTLATSFLALALHDAGALARPGFQLSFAGVAGLLLAAPIERPLRRVLPGELLRTTRSAIAAGVAATLLTLPVVAWHFDQVSLVGIPATLLGTPLVAAAIPGAFASLLADAVHPALGAFVAGGTDLVLDVYLRMCERMADLPFAVAWVPRSWIFAGGGGALLALVLLSGARRVGALVRGTVVVMSVIAGVLLLPVGRVIGSRGTAELVFLDVGQGDAILVRSPGSRWLLVDTGPPAGFSGSGTPAVIPLLIREGVQRLEAMVLTHAHLDHIGGAARVLEELPVGAVIDPGMPRGTTAFVKVLESAEAEGSGWRSARRGDRFELDGLGLEVMHSLEDDAAPLVPGGDVVNESSVVLLVSFGAFSALLTGDAPAPAEEGAARASGPVDVLKVGHHGSRTSSSEAFLELSRPDVAVISVGRGNSYGHPHAPVVEVLGARVRELYQTDQHGTIRIIIRRDGTYSVRAERSQLND
jgi:competence protein ComEC